MTEETEKLPPICTGLVCHIGAITGIGCPGEYYACKLLAKRDK